ncbi:MAG TPA: NYN domain-containing protein [Longimicrobium sp.]|jgi:uncharacterized LabA/DUF88 family protein
MDQFVIMVDAGYLYAAAGELCYGTTSRRELRLDASRVNVELAELCAKHSGQKYLRTYWYDAAPNALPTFEHNSLADQRGIKLRLGRMTHGGQKGVDSRIVRDLIVLPRNGAVRTIFLLSGDEDVREGVAEAQELGVAVVLIGIESPVGRRNQAETLVREADDRIILSRTECLAFLGEIAGGTLAPTSGAPAAQGSIPPTSVPTALSAAGGSVQAGAAQPGVIGPDDWKAFGTKFAADWQSKNEASAIAAVIAGQPRLPITVDGPLLRAASAHFGVVLEEGDRRAIRAGFWEGVRTDLKS